jgi:hypothetical protein
MGLFTNFRNHVINILLNRIVLDDDVMYVWCGKGTSWIDENDPERENFSVKSSELDIRNDMLFGKRITPQDIALLIPKNEWSPQVFSMYDHRDMDLLDKKFFVVNTVNNVYKCLFNNNEDVSTVEPTFISNTSVELADGYIWKYMYTIDSAADLKFSSSTEIPITANTSVINSAVDGSIEVVKVENKGGGYIAINSGIVQEVVSNTVLRIENTAQSANNFYTKSAFYVSSGLGSGEVREIASYFANSTGRYVLLDSSLIVDQNSTYEIAPKITITGDGINAKAYCSVNETTGQIETISMITTGEKYTVADVTISANTIHGSGAVSTAIISPIGGHGAKPDIELGNSKICISVDFLGSESFTLPTDVTYRQMGIINNPLEDQTLDPFTDPKFIQIVRFEQVLSGVSPFPSDEIIIGNTSNARAKVISANTTHTAVTMISGTFVETEVVIGQTTFISGQIFNITSKDLDKYSGDILFYDNFLPIARTDESSETLKLIIEF